MCVTSYISVVQGSVIGQLAKQRCISACPSRRLESEEWHFFLSRCTMSHLRAIMRASDVWTSVYNTQWVTLIFASRPGSGAQSSSSVSESVSSPDEIHIGSDIPPSDSAGSSRAVLRFVLCLVCDNFAFDTEGTRGPLAAWTRLSSLSDSSSTGGRFVARLGLLRRE